MKRFVHCLIAWMMAGVLLLMMTGCAAENAPVQTTIRTDHGTYEVNLINGRVRLQGDTYLYDYELTGTRSDFTVSITYPNGAVYREQVARRGFGKTTREAWYTADYDNETYADGAHMAEALDELATYLPASFQLPDIDWWMLVVGVLLAVGGVIYIRYPREVLIWANWTRVEQPEPTAYAVWRAKTGGWILLAVSVLMVIVSLT